MKHNGKKCECGEPVRLNLTSGRNKGYYRTCGKEECLARGVRSERAKGARIKSLKERTCQKCKVVYKPTSTNQKWCEICAPDRAAQSRLRRYGVSAPEFEAMKAKNGGLCPLCMKRPATDLDHSHITGQARGALCGRCNGILGNVEDLVWLERAIKYAIQIEGATGVS